MTGQHVQTRPDSWVARARARAKRFAISPGPLALITFVIYAIYAVSRQTQFLTAGYDLGIFAQAVKAYAHFQAPIVTLKGMDFNILGDHFHPILALLAPLWWVWPSSSMLLVAQAGLVALSILPVWWFTRRRMSLAATNAVAFAYAFSWMLQGLVDFDFHEIAFAIAILPFVIDLMDRRRYGWAVVVASLLLLVREDMAFIVVMLAVLLLIRRQWKWAIVALGAAAVGYAVAMVWVIPFFSPTGAYAYWSLGQFGPTPISALGNMITQPWHTIQTLLGPEVKLQTIFLLLVPFLFLSLGSPYVLLLLPIVVQRFLSDREVFWGTEFHYSAILAPILAMSAVDTVGRLVDRFGQRRVLTGVFATWAAGFVLIGMAYSSYLYPVQRLFTGAVFVDLPRAQNLRAAIASVPTNVCVETDDRIVPAVMQGRVVTLPGRSDGQATWMVLDMEQAEVGKDLPTPLVAEAQARTRGFVVHGIYGQIVVLNRPGAAVSSRCAAG